MVAYFTAPRVALGPGAIEQLSGLGTRRAAVVVDAAVARTNGDRRIVEELAKGDATVERIVAPTAPDGLGEVRALADRLRGVGPDWIVAVGGGRTLDAAKAARLLYEQPTLSLAAPPPVLDLGPSPRSRLVAVPTTSGSGADASWTADLVAEDGSPLEIADRSLIPEWTLVDDGFARDLSPELRLDGAFEAFALAAEAYLSAWSNPISDALALDAARTVLLRFPHALRWSDDPDAKTALHTAATLAGLAASNAQRGLAHALARALTGATGIAYGRLLGIVLPTVLEFDRPGARERVEALAAATSAPGDPGRGTVPERLRRLADSFRFPTDLVRAGVAVGDWSVDRATVVARTLRSPAVLANPRVPSTDDVESILTTVAGGRPA